MQIRFVFALLIAASLAAPGGGANAATSPDSAARPPDKLSALLADLGAMARARDSLTTIADTTRGTSREVLEELVWQRDVEIHGALLALADELKSRIGRGEDVTQARRLLSDAVRRGWPRYVGQLERRLSAFGVLSGSSDNASGAERLAIEAALTHESDRILRAYESLVDVLLAFERSGVDVADQRAFLVRGLPLTCEGLITRIKLANRDQDRAAVLLSRGSPSADDRFEFEATEERVKRSTNSLAAAIRLMDRLGLASTDLRVDLIAITGKLTTDVFRWKVLLGLLSIAWTRFIEFLAAKAPQWIFQGLLVILTFLGFRALSRVVRKAMRRAVQYSPTSELMRGTIVRLSSHAVMLIGFLVILPQLGVQVAPLLAGLGIAGVVIGFAMQNTLSNFAAGGMILGNQPFDVGDEIEVAGVLGVVKRMSLVSTTILTPDNQTLIIPNSAVWGGVIRNRTAQPIRRVDLSFGIGYANDVEQAERVLREIVAADAQVLKDPAPVIRLHQLADSSVIFVVRVWAANQQYWEVYWSLTRAVKLRFDQESITIPFPQREVHLNIRGAGSERSVAPLAGPPPES